MAFRNKKKHRFRGGGEFDKLADLAEAEFLIEGRQWRSALSFLYDAAQKYPTDTRFWEMLAEVGSHLRNAPAMQDALSRLVKLRPDDPDAWYHLAHAYGLDEYAALCRRTVREFLDRFPNDDKRTQALTMLDIAERELQATVTGYGFPVDEAGYELLCIHEESQILLRQGHLAEARQKAEYLIGRMQDFVPAYNNLSLIFYADGKVEKAFETAQEVLAKQPENFHALANLVRYSIHLGREEDARQFADRLRLAESHIPVIWAKKLEAFTFVGDDQAVVDTYNKAVKRSMPPDNFGTHLAAYAFYRLGKESEARKLWRKIIKSDADFELAAKNLEEIELPEDKRNIVGMPLNYWIPAPLFDDLQQRTLTLKDGKNFEKNLKKKMTRFLDDHPNLLVLCSIFLKRGDEGLREFAVKMLDWAGTPESHAALKDFALGQNGSEEMRFKAAMALSEANAIPRNVAFWRDGEWRETRLLTFKITGEPVENYPLKPKAQKLLKKGYDATQKQQLDLAEQYYKLAHEANGANHPSIMFNLLTVDRMRGIHANAEATLRKIVADFPDYSFGAISLAKIEVEKGNLEKAKDLVERFYDKEQWHFSEISIWLHFNIELALAENQFDNARMHLNMLRNIDDNPVYDDWEQVITRREMAHKLSTIPSKPTGRKKKK